MKKNIDLVQLVSPDRKDQIRNNVVLSYDLMTSITNINRRLKKM